MLPSPLSTGAHALASLTVPRRGFCRSAFHPKTRFIGAETRTTTSSPRQLPGALGRRQRRERMPPFFQLILSPSRSNIATSSTPALECSSSPNLKTPALWQTTSDGIDLLDPSVYPTVKLDALQRYDIEDDPLHVLALYSRVAHLMTTGLSIDAEDTVPDIDPDSEWDTLKKLLEAFKLTVKGPKQTTSRKYEVDVRMRPPRTHVSLFYDQNRNSDAMSWSCSEDSFVWALRNLRMPAHLHRITFEVDSEVSDTTQPEDWIDLFQVHREVEILRFENGLIDVMVLAAISGDQHPRSNSAATQESRLLAGETAEDEKQTLRDWARAQGPCLANLRLIHLENITLTKGEFEDLSHMLRRRAHHGSRTVVVRLGNVEGSGEGSSESLLLEAVVRRGNVQYVKTGEGEDSD